MPPAGYQPYCFMHLKVNARNAQTVIEMLEERFGDRWSEFVVAVKAEAK